MLLKLSKNEQHQKFLSLLQLFAYKTYQDYIRASGDMFIRSLTGYLRI